MTFFEFYEKFEQKKRFLNRILIKKEYEGFNKEKKQNFFVRKQKAEKFIEELKKLDDCTLMLYYNQKFFQSLIKSKDEIYEIRFVSKKTIDNIKETQELFSGEFVKAVLRRGELVETIYIHWTANNDVK